MTQPRYSFSGRKEVWSLQFVIWPRQNSEVDVLAIECPPRLYQAWHIPCIAADCDRRHSVFNIILQNQRLNSCQRYGDSRTRIRALETIQICKASKCCRDDQVQQRQSMNVTTVQKMGRKSLTPVFCSRKPAGSIVFWPSPWKYWEPRWQRRWNRCVPTYFRSMHSKPSPFFSRHEYHFQIIWRPLPCVMDSKFLFTNEFNYG